MPNIISNAKSLKKDQERRKFRLHYKKKLKKTINEGLETKTINEIYKSLDSQLSKGIIKKNRCNKLKSKYMLAINSVTK